MQRLFWLVQKWVVLVRAPQWPRDGRHTRSPQGGGARAETGRGTGRGGAGGAGAGRGGGTRRRRRKAGGGGTRRVRAAAGVPAPVGMKVQFIHHIRKHFIYKLKVKKFCGNPPIPIFNIPILKIPILNIGVDY